MSSVEYNFVSPFYLKRKKVSLLTELFACGKNGLMNINLSIKFKKKDTLPDVVEHAFKLITWEVEASGFL